MKKIPRKNYYILSILLVVTVLLTLFLSNMYLNKEKQVSDFYEYSNKITTSEVKQFMTENSDAIIYLSDKYDLDNKKVEKKLKTKIEQLNLSDKLVFIDKKDINKKFIKEIKDKYKTNISLDKMPTILVIVDNKVIKNIAIEPNTDVDSLIKKEDFE